MLDIYVNHDLFTENLSVLGTQLESWTTERDDVFNALGAIKDIWSGDESEIFFTGSDCVRAQFVQNNRDLAQLHTYAQQALQYVVDADEEGSATV